MMDNYEKISVLGEGASSVVFLVQHRVDQQKYVIKRFFHSIVSDDWKREIAILERLEHSQIPKYVDNFFLKVEGRTLPHLIMDFIPGHNLEALVKSYLSDAEKISHLMRSVLDVVRYTHSLSPPVIHRDIKPANIIIGEDATVYLIDFGVATEDRDLTVGHSINTGTLGYQAPEQIIGNPTVKSDVYSLGVLGVYLFTGIKPRKMMKEGYLLNWREHCIQPINQMSNADQWWMWLEGMLEEDVEKRFDVEQAILHLPKMISHKNHRNENQGEKNPFLQKLKAVRKENINQQRIQKEKQREQKRRHRIEKEKSQTLQLRIEQKKQDYVEEISTSWSEMVHSIDDGTLEAQEAVSLFWETYKGMRYVEVDNQRYDVNHVIFTLVQQFLSKKSTTNPSLLFLDRIKNLFSSQNQPKEAFFDSQEYWEFVEGFFDVAETHIHDQKIRHQLIQSKLELEFMDLWSKNWGKEGDLLKEKILKLERQVQAKQQTFDSLHQAMIPYFFFTEHFEHYKELYFENPNQHQNQNWEVSILEALSGMQKMEEQSANDFREFALTQQENKIQQKYLLIGTPFILLGLWVLSLLL
jgi:serine/threonine protein kinase